MSRAEHWYAVECSPRKENAACEHIEAFGLGAYVPMQDRSVIVNRYTKQRELKKFPIVSGIVFVNSPEAMTAHLARTLIAPVCADERLTPADMPNGSNSRFWQRMTASLRNCQASPVTGVYGSDGVPTEIRWREIEFMVEQNKDHDALVRARYRGEMPEYPAGTLVRMKEGPLSGFNGIVVDGLHNRLNVLVNILGRETKAELSVDQVDLV